MLVHLHLPDPVFGVEAACGDCDAPLPVGVVAFRQRWYVGQVCLRCRRLGWTLGTYDTPNVAQRALVDFVKGRLDCL
jgi:hypothetical protein